MELWKAGGVAWFSKIDFHSLGRRAFWLIEALEAGDQFFCEGFAGLGPEESAGDAAVLFDR